MFAANYCPPPPEPETGGTAKAVSTGNHFGVMCPGLEVDYFDVLPDCPWLAVVYERNKSTRGVADYTIRITTTNVRADKVFVLLKFDANITSVVNLVRKAHAM